MLFFESSIILFIAIVIAAALYSSIGHGGASGYLAAMALFGLEPTIMKPAALTMNIFVTILILWRFKLFSQINWRLFFPLLFASLPFAYIGGSVTVESNFYITVVGLLLLLASLPMFLSVKNIEKIQHPETWLIVLVGGGLGFISGLTGVGGGIYLSPILLLLRWSNVKESIPLVAAFIFTNSIAGLTGYVSTKNAIPDDTAVYIAMAMIGAFIGTEVATRKLAPQGLKYVLGVVLVIAGSKMILTT